MLVMETLHWRTEGAQPVVPQGSRFFHFDVQILRNVATSRVGAPVYDVGASPTGNPGSVTAMVLPFSHPYSIGKFHVDLIPFSMLEKVLIRKPPLTVSEALTLFIGKQSKEYDEIF